MSNYSLFPPEEFFELVLKHCPQAGFVYKELWRYFFQSDDNLLQKKDVRPIFGMAPTAFRNKLLLLKRESLLEYKENSLSYKIYLTTSEEDQ